MVKVTLKLMTIFATDIGLTQIDYSSVEILGEVINQFTSEYGQKIRKSLKDSQGNLANHVVILVNGRNYMFLNELDTKLKDGDQITISPPLFGG